MKEAQRLLDDTRNGKISNHQSSYQQTIIPAQSISNASTPRTDKIVFLSKNQRNGPSFSYRGPAYMSTSAFQTMAEEIERQKEHSRLSRSASVGGDMTPSALNPVLTGNWAKNVLLKLDCNQRECSVEVELQK